MKPVLFLLALSLCLAPLTLLAAEDQLDDTQIRILIDSKDQWQQLRGLDLDIVWAEDNYAEIITNPAQIETLHQLGFATEMIHESVGAFYRSRLAIKDMGGYKTLAEIEQWIDFFISENPNIASVKQSIGLTIEGRPIWAFKVSDNPNVDEDEPEVLYTAATHCREVNTPEILFTFVQYLADNYDTDPEIKDLVDNREIWIIAVVNPDGYYHNQVIAPFGGGLWRKNRRDNGDGSFGVDLNRNFGYEWGYDDIGSSTIPSSVTYRGTGPFSEPETQNFRDFVIAHEFVLGIDWHQYSNITLYPWGYQILETPDHDVYTAIGDTIFNMNGYIPGLVGQLLYSANGSSFDWEYGEQTLKNKMFGMTLEAGTSSDGFWPSMSRALEQREENIDPMLFLTRLAGNIYSLRAPAAPVMDDLPESVEGALYSVSWTHDDPENPAQKYELIELQQRRIMIDPGESFNDWANDGFSISVAQAYSPPESFYSGGLNGTAVSLQTAYSYTVLPGDQLTFRTRYDIEFYYDFAYVQVSTDGTSFVSIPGNITSDFNPYGGNHGNGISGSSSGWVEATFDLSAYEGQEVWFRFRYETDGNTLDDGFYVDDIYPHLVFDTKTIIDSDITAETYALYNRPTGVYYYQVRAQDTESQWSSTSTIVQTNVLSGGNGDIDLDGITSSIADLTLYSLYFQHGLSVFDIYLGTQIGQTDINCDGLTLSVADVNSLSQLVLGAITPCFAGGVNDALGTDRLAPPQTTDLSRSRTEMTSAAVAAAIETVTFAVELNITEFSLDDSAWVDITLTEASTSLLGFQFHLQYDNSLLTLQDMRLGGDLATWQVLDYHESTAGSLTDLTIAGLAQSAGGAPIGASDIDLSATPATLVRLKFGMTPSETSFATNINFAWTDCGDNSLVAGSLNGADLELDSLLLSQQVTDADGSIITSVDPVLGGADYTCFYGLFGTAPASAVDFTSGRLNYDPSCCVGVVGEINGLGDGDPTIGDISSLIDFLFISGTVPGCLTEADINQSGGSSPTEDDVTISDASILIDHLFISSAPLLDCL